MAKKLPPLPEWAEQLGLKWEGFPLMGRLFLGRAVMWKEGGYYYCNKIDGTIDQVINLGNLGVMDAIYLFLHRCREEYYDRELVDLGLKRRFTLAAMRDLDEKIKAEDLRRKKGG